jgi:hypothetical protein
VLRKALNGIERFVGTTETSKHRIFQFIPVATLADHMIVCVASEDAGLLGVMSSSVHGLWALRRGGTLEDRPRYNKSVCFDPFPFPALEEGPLKERIRDLGERLDAHRKARQAAHPDLTLTGMYNVLEKLRTGELLSDKEQKIHDQGLVSILKQIHDDLDAAVFEAYGWQDLHEAMQLAQRGTLVDFETGNTTQLDAEPGELDKVIREHEEALEQVLLTRLVSLNHQRAAEEKKGLIRWLRPEYQAPTSPVARQTAIDLPSETGQPEAAPSVPLAWPESLAAQVAAIEKLLPISGSDPDVIAAHFGKRSKARITKIGDILETLQTLGRL